MKKSFHVKSNKKGVEVAVTTSAKIHFLCKLLQWRTLCIKKGSMHEKDTTIVNIDAPKIRAPKDRRQTLADPKVEMRLCDNGRRL